MESLRKKSVSAFLMVNGLFLLMIFSVLACSPSPLPKGKRESNSGSSDSEGSSLALKVVPASLLADLGETVTLRVENPVQGSSYQWFKDGQALLGETSIQLNLTLGSLLDFSTYYVVRRRNNGDSISNSVLVNRRDGGVGDGDPLDVRCAHEAKVTRNVRLTFAKSDEQCAWGSDGNDPRTGGNLAARHEFSQALNLGLGEGICRISLESQVSDLRYDDHLSLQFNNRMLFSTFEGFNRLDKDENSHPIYGWSKIRGVDMNMANVSQNCLGTCEYPTTDTDGDFHLSFASEVLLPMARTRSLQEAQEFTLVVYGDNDDSDCKFKRDITLDLSLEVVQ